MGVGQNPQHRSPTLQAGKLRHRISIVKVNPTQDSTGGTDLSVDVVYASVYASIEAVGGSESMAAGQETSVVTHQIIIRFIGAAPSWQSGFAVLPGALVVDPNGALQQAQAPGGLTGNVAPTWALVQGTYTADGQPSTPFNWKHLGPAPLDTGVNAAMQVWFRSRQFQITNVQNPDERNKMLILGCVEINDSLQQSGPLGNPTGQSAPQ
jgi:head-tail adaptor